MTIAHALFRSEAKPYWFEWRILGKKAKVATCSANMTFVYCIIEASALLSLCVVLMGPVSDCTTLCKVKTLSTLAALDALDWYGYCAIPICRFE